LSEKFREWPLLIYLDQKGWIDLARASKVFTGFFA
jgi:hypothetical protein